MTSSLRGLYRLCFCVCFAFPATDGTEYARGKPRCHHRHRCIAVLRGRFGNRAVRWIYKSQHCIQ